MNMQVVAFGTTTTFYSGDHSYNTGTPRWKYTKSGLIPHTGVQPWTDFSCYISAINGSASIPEITHCINAN